MKKLLVLVAALATLLVGAGAAYAFTQYNLQSGTSADHIIVEQWLNGGNNVGPGDIGDSVVCPEGYYVTGGGYSYGAQGFHVYFNGPVSGWGGLGTAWSVGGVADNAGAFRVWAICLELT